MPQKACKDNQIRNPKTDRCVNKDGAIGKKLLKEPKEAKQSKETKQPNGKCPETKIINPKSGRCVNKDSAIGKKLLKEETKPKKEPKPKPKEPEIKKFMIKKKSVSSEDFIKMRDDFDSNTYEWTKQAYKEGLKDTEILSYSSLGENEYKLLNAFFTPEKIIENMLDFSYLYENLLQARRENKIIYILECSGGIGNIIYYILEAISNSNDDLLKYIKIDFVEINKTFIEIAKAKLDKYKDIINYHNMSFFNFETKIKYKFIFGNPPYKMTINNKNIYDVDFFLKCWDLLSFKIIFLMSSSSLQLNTTSHKKFINIIDNENIKSKLELQKKLIDYGKLYIYENEFKKGKTQAGITGVKTFLYVLNKNDFDD